MDHARRDIFLMSNCMQYHTHYVNDYVQCHLVGKKITYFLKSFIFLSYQETRKRKAKHHDKHGKNGKGQKRRHLITATQHNRAQRSSSASKLHSVTIKNGLIITRPAVVNQLLMSFLYREKLALTAYSPATLAKRGYTDPATASGDRVFCGSLSAPR